MLHDKDMSVDSYLTEEKEGEDRTLVRPCNMQQRGAISSSVRALENKSCGRCSVPASRLDVQRVLQDMLT